MTRERRIGIGILAGAGLLILFVGGMFLAHEAGSLKYTIQFENAEGLAKGDRVIMSGVDIGVVQAVILHAQPTRVEVRVKIEPEHAKKVRADSTAIIGSSSFPNVSGQHVVEVINPETDRPAPPLEDGAVVVGMDGMVGLTAWKLKHKLGGGADSARGVLVAVQDGLKSSLDQINELRTSPQVKEAVDSLKSFATKMQEKGKSAVAELGEEWTGIKEKMAPVLKELSDFGRHYIVDQIKYLMEQIEKTLQGWREEAGGGGETPAEAGPEPAATPPAA